MRAERDNFDQVDDAEFNQLLTDLMATEWVVYSKPVIAKTRTVVEYLARYTKRIGLSNARLLKMDEHHVWLSYRDYRGDGTRSVMRLAGEELLRRFLLHLLPKRFMRVRYYGYLANAHRRRKLVRIREAMSKAEKPEKCAPTQVAVGYQPMCRDCQKPMTLVRELQPDRTLIVHDSS